MQNTHRLLIALVLAAALGGIIYISATHKEDAQTALLNAFANVYEPHNSKEVYDIEATIEAPQESGKTGTDVISLHIENTSNHARTFQDVKSEVLLRGKGNPGEGFDLSFEAQLRLVDGTFYARLSKMPDASSIPEEAKLITNLWFAANPIDLAKKFGNENAAKQFEDALGSGAEANRKESIEKVSNAYHANPFMTNILYTGAGMVGETKVRTVTFSIDKNLLAGFILEMQSYIAEKEEEMTGVHSTDELTHEDVMDILNDITFKELSAKIGASDKRIHGFAMKMDITDDSDGSTGGLSIVITSENLKGPVVVKKPDSFLPVDDILKASLSAAKEKAERAKVYSGSEK